MRAEPAERAVQRDAGAGQAVAAQVGAEREGVFGLGQRVQVPAVQLAELLAEFPDVEPDVAGQAGPVGVTFLDAHLAVLEAHEDLRIRIGIERRLEPDLELPRIEVFPLDARLLCVGAHVSGDADLGVELRLAALAPDELGRARRVRLEPGRVRPGGGRGGGPQRREGRVLRGGGRDCRWPATERRAQAVELQLERAHLGRERVQLPLRRLLRGTGPGVREQPRDRGDDGVSMSKHPRASPVQMFYGWRPATAGAHGWRFPRGAGVRRCATAGSWEALGVGS